MQNRLDINEERKKLAVDIGDNMVNPEEVGDMVSDAPAKQIWLDVDDEGKRLVVDIGDNTVNPEEVGDTDSGALALKQNRLDADDEEKRLVMDIGDNDDDDNLQSANIFMLQQHAHCA